MRRGIRVKGIKVIVKPNGKRYVYRRVGSALIPLPDLPENDPRFLAAYAAAGDAPARPRSTDTPGTIAALCTAYLGSSAYARLSPSTRAVWRRTIDRIKAQRGAGMLHDLRPEHLRKDVRALTPGAASNRLKAWRSLLSYAVEEGMIDTDPSRVVRSPRGIVTPHRQWTPAEIAAYRARWPVGSPERLAMEVIYWTGARCVDAVRLGHQMVDRAGWLTFTQAKTSGPASCPVTAPLPIWCRALADDQRHLLSCLPSDRMLWIVTRTGAARSVKGLSQWLSAAASKAGLPEDCTAHGLRKARAAAIAEVGGTSSQIGAWTGHASLSEIAHYTRAADKIAILRGPEQERNTGNSSPSVSKKAEKDE